MAPNYLNDLLELIPPNVTRAKEGDVRLMREMDASIQGDNEDLKERLEALQRTVRDFISAIMQDVWAWEPDGNTAFDVPELPNKIIMQEHRKRVRQLTLSAGRDIDNGYVCWLEDGGIKSPERLAHKLSVKADKSLVGDISRLRYVTPGIADLYSTVYRLHLRLPELLDLRLMAVRDFYDQGDKSKYASPFRGINTNWIRPYAVKGNLADTLLTEIQVVTKRTRATMDLNHPFDVAKHVAYPSPEHQNWMHGVMMKASVLDLTEFSTKYKDRIHQIAAQKKLLPEV